MKLHLYSRLLLLTVAFSVTSSEFISNEIGNAHKLEKRSADNPEEEPLPRHITPNSYKLELQPFFHEGQFRGKLEVNISCHEPTNVIVLHANRDLQVAHTELAIHSIGLWDESAERTIFRQIETSHHYERITPKYTPHSVSISKIERNSNKDWYEIVLKEKLKKGMMYLVKLEFLGNITVEGRTGLYRRNYIDNGTKEERWYMATNWRNRNARKVFPCFDDPSFKASIQLSIALPISLKAVTTMPLESTGTMKNQMGWKMDRFAASPPMAVQSLGVIIFDATQIVPLMSERVDDVTINVYGQATAKNGLQSKMKNVVSSLHKLQKFFGVDYPLPELTLVTLPSDRGHSGFWGLITFSESSLDSEMFLPLYLLPRQWIDHMATPDTQTVQVAEGLQIYVALDVSIEAIHLTENIEDTLMWVTFFGPEVYNSINGYPQTWINTFQISWMWTMLNNTLTEETFRLGIYNFMRDKAFKTFNEDDIFGALSNQAWLDGVLPWNVSVQDIAESWIDKSLFPIVTVTRNYEENSATVQQHPFLPETRENQTQEMKDHLFWVPLFYITEKNLNKGSVKLAAWMQEKQRIINDLPTQDDFIIVNPEHTGMYWVNYDQTNWHLLCQYLLKSGTDKSLTPIPGITRSKLLYDAAMLAVAGELDFPTALNMTLFLRYDRNPNVWITMTEVLQQITRILDDTSIFDKFLVYCKSLYTPAYKYFVENMKFKEYSDELFMDNLRVTAGEVGYVPAMTEAQRNFRLSLGNNSMLNSRALCGILRWSDDDWELALQYVLTTVPTNETSYTNYFNDLVWCNRKPEKLNRILYLLFVDDRYEFSDKDAKNILDAIHDYNTLLLFISDHWDEIKSRYGNNTEIWNLLFEAATEDVSTQKDLRLVSQLYENHHTQLLSAKSIVEKSLTQIEENLNSKYKYLKDIEMWLDLQLPSL